MPRIPDRPPRPMTETQLSAHVRAWADEQGWRLWRNNSGKLQDATGRWVTFGLGVGSPDLVGVRPVIITPEHIGQRLGVFKSLELKLPGRHLTPDQEAWQRMLRALGAEYDVVRTLDDLVRAP